MLYACAPPLCLARVTGSRHPALCSLHGNTPSQGSANRSASEGVLGAMARPAPVSPLFNSF